MKTKLPKSITSVEEAKVFLTELHNNKEAFHPEDDANECDWVMIEDENQIPSVEECNKLNKLMQDIYLLKGNENNLSMLFDPCMFLLQLSGHEMD